MQPTDQPELFSLGLGGYGLFGVVLDVELRLIRNERYRLDCDWLPTEQAALALTAGPSEEKMAYARLCVAPAGDAFLRQSYLVRLTAEPGDPPSLHAPGYAARWHDAYQMLPAPTTPLAAW